MDSFLEGLEIRWQRRDRLIVRTSCKRMLDLIQIKPSARLRAEHSFDYLTEDFFRCFMCGNILVVSTNDHGNKLLDFNVKGIHVF
jgi:hypothetical protein